MSALPTGNFAPTTGIVQKDGLTYCVNAPLPSFEADLIVQTGLNPPGLGVVNPGQGVPLRWGQAVVATVLFTVNQAVTGPLYVVLQGDNADQNWFDVAGCVLTGTLQPATFQFELPCGPYGTVAVLQQTRKLNVAPAANFFNPCPPPGRVRFTGKGAGSGSGSSAAAVVSIYFRLPPLR